MNTPKQIQEYIDALVRQGVKARDAAPPLYRWLWRKGINIAPPFNQTFFHHFIVTGLFWGGFMAIGMTLLFMLLHWVFGSGDSSILVAALSQPTFYPAIFAGGLVFGMITAGIVKRRGHSLQRPTW